MKDIYIDNSTLQKFKNGVSDEHWELGQWLITEGWLVWTAKIAREYLRSTRGARADENLLLLAVDHLTASGRLNTISNSALKNFSFPKKEYRRMRCNSEDHDNVKAVLISSRKLALTNDDALNDAINSSSKIKKIKPQASNSPSSLPYK